MIYDLDVYQVKNQSNFDVHPRLRGILTIHKSVSNTILKTQNKIDPNECIYTFLENRYATPQLLEIMTTECNIRVAGKFRKN